VQEAAGRTAVFPSFVSIAKHNTGEVYRCDVVVSEVEIWID